MYLDRDGYKTKTCFIWFILQTPPPKKKKTLTQIFYQQLIVDTGIRDIILTGNFNFDMQKTHTARKKMISV